MKPYEKLTKQMLSHATVVHSPVMTVITPSRDSSDLADILVCTCVQIRLHHRRQVVELLLEPDNCTDMTGAVELSAILMPEVLNIVTQAGDLTDTVYRRDSIDGEWKASDCRGLPNPIYVSL